MKANYRDVLVTYESLTVDCRGFEMGKHQKRHNTRSFKHSRPYDEFALFHFLHNNRKPSDSSLNIQASLSFIRWQQQDYVWVEWSN